MKILSISNCPLVETSGSGYVITNFCYGLQERGHEVDLFGPDSYEVLKFFKGRATHYRQALGMLFFTKRQLTKKNYDIVEFYGGESWLIALLLSKNKNPKRLLVSHSNGLETYFYQTLIEGSQYGWVENPLEQWYQFNQSSWFKYAFTSVDAIVTVSENERNYALKHQYQNEDRVMAIEPCLLKDYLGLTVEFERKQIIGYCGSWIARKGTQAIATDISRLLVDFPDCVFQLIGVGKSFKKEEYFPLELGSRIEVIPFVANKEELREIYKRISILVVPSIYESFGLVMPEAMACGCAIVAGKTGFAVSLKNNQEAVVLEQPCSPFLYEGVKQLLLNESFRQYIAKNGYNRVQCLDWDWAVKRVETQYISWLEEVREESIK